VPKRIAVDYFILLWKAPKRTPSLWWGLGLMFVGIASNLAVWDTAIGHISSNWDSARGSLYEGRSPKTPLWKGIPTKGPLLRKGQPLNATPRKGLIP